MSSISNTLGRYAFYLPIPAVVEGLHQAGISKAYTTPLAIFADAALHSGEYDYLYESGDTIFGGVYKKIPGWNNGVAYNSIIQAIERTATVLSVTQLAIDLYKGEISALPYISAIGTASLSIAALAIKASFRNVEKKVDDPIKNRGDTPTLEAPPPQESQEVIS